MAKELFPGWIQYKEDIAINRISGALTNAIFFVDAGGKRRLLRVYGVGVDQLIDREKELAWLARLGRLNLGPRLLAIFGNGRFEEYVESITLNHNDIREPNISKQIAQCMARQHAIVKIYPPQQKKDTDDRHILEIWQNVDKWYALVMRLLPTLKQQHPHWIPLLDLYNFDQLGKDIERSKEILSDIKSPIVFGHNDLQYGNILKRDDTGALVLVDFEYAGYNTRGFDLANHFVEWRYDYHGERPAAMTEPFPTKEEQVRFIQAYMDTNKTELGMDDDTSVEEIQKEMEAWLMGTHLGWGLWGLVQASQSEIDFDYFYYSMERLNAFREELVKWNLLD
ncbi:kinase-like domain-containing protein [Halteromyces radiatus]|uniref:kinase-like domain-containing protein n=1 Tax=Halteromyces radiatus TaxID=101107 RepID=UPI00221FDFC2|nr:kinase-like domain-containing protein [Halteromyces radiatus]KAI8089878.1 kinase-like domain-containing protein [Halteromyces radiatus]